MEQSCHILSSVFDILHRLSRLYDDQLVLRCTNDLITYRIRRAALLGTLLREVSSWVDPVRYDEGFPADPPDDSPKSDRLYGFTPDMLLQKNRQDSG